MIIFIDLENVHNGGFNGIEQLDEEDKLLIFYSENSSNISIATHRKIEESKAGKEYFSVKAGGNNALDFQLVTYLGYLLASDKKSDYYIISNDTGFDYVIDFWKRRNIKISRCMDLSRTPQENIEAEIKRLFPEYKSDVGKIVGIINKYKTKSGINTALVKEFGSEKTGVIYKGIKPYIKGKKGK